VLGQAPASLQVESPHGRRGKVRAANVLLSFEQLPPAGIARAGAALRRGLEVDFLWQCSGPAEFDFRSLARDYVGREPTAVEAAGVLLKLHHAPMYFYRRGKGASRRPGGDAQARALAGLGKKESAWPRSRRLGRNRSRASSARSRSLR